MCKKFIERWLNGRFVEVETDEYESTEEVVEEVVASDDVIDSMNEIADTVENVIEENVKAKSDVNTLDLIVSEMETCLEMFKELLERYKLERCKI